MLNFGPWALIASKRRGGLHAYYDDTESRGNSKWAALGCSGEVRGGKGYLILHNDGPEVLAEALERRVEGARAWPCDLFEMAGLPPVVAVREPMPFAEVREPELDRSPLIELPLEQIQGGGRNNALFDQVRLWAYQQSKGADLIDWKARVLAYALRQNDRFPRPFSQSEVEDDVVRLAWNVASWIWSGGGAFDHGFVAQSRRGVASAKVRRYRTADRDRSMVARLDAGERTDRHSCGPGGEPINGFEGCGSPGSTCKKTQICTYLIPRWVGFCFFVFSFLLLLPCICVLLFSLAGRLSVGPVGKRARFLPFRLRAHSAFPWALPLSSLGPGGKTCSKMREKNFSSPCYASGSGSWRARKSREPVAQA